MLRRRYWLLASLLLCSRLHAAVNLEIPGCGNLAFGFGPFDYRTAQPAQIDVVERYHFTTQVESLRAGLSSSYVVNDLDYALRALPNHPRALAAMVRYDLAGGKFTSVEMGGAECYLRRALALAPDDAAVFLLYGNYLFKSGHADRADEMYASAVRLNPDSAEIAYNAGLYHVSRGDLDKAEALAKVAYDMGYPLPGLRNKLDAARRSAANPKAEPVDSAKRPAARKAKP
jgi:Flp pilus assembly protein TadD